MKKRTGLLVFTLMMALLFALCSQTAKAENDPVVMIPSYILADNYQAGEPIYITFPEGIPENYRVYISVTDENGEEVRYDWFNPNGLDENYRASLFWKGLDEGTYTAVLWSSCTENNTLYYSGEETRALTVSGERPAAPTVEILNNTAVMSENEGWYQGCEIIVTSPGITDFFLCGYDSDGKENIISSLVYVNGGSHLIDASQMSIDVTARHPGTYWYDVMTLQDGRWSAVSDTFTLTFEAATPWPVTPEMTVPETLRAGETVNIGILSGFPEDGCIYIETKDLSDESIVGYERLYSYEVDENGTFGLHQYGLDPGTYKITAYYDVSRYENSESVSYSLTISGTRPETPQVTVSVNDALVNSTNEIIVSGAEITAYEIMQYYDQSNGRMQSGEDGKWQHTDEGTLLPVSLTYSPDDTFTGQNVRHNIRVKINGCWTDWSDEFVLSWQPLPAAPTQTITWKDEYLAGEPITVTLERALDQETNERIGINIYEYGGDWIAGGSIYSNETANGNLTFVIGEKGLDAGRYDFEIFFSMDGCNRSEGLYSNAFAVTGDRPAAPTLSVTNNNALQSESITVVAAAEGLTEVYFEYTTEENGNYYSSRYAYGNGSAIWTMWNYGNNMSRWVRAMAKIDGQWSFFSDDIKVTWRTLGVAPVPEVRLPETLLAGQPLTAILPDGLAYDERLEFALYQEGNEYASSWRYIYGPVAAGGEIVLEDVGLDSGSYLLKVTASKTNYEDSEETTVGSLTVTGERPAVPTVTLSSTSYDGIEPIIVTVTGEGLERVSQSGTEYLATGGRVTFSFVPAYNQRLWLRAKIGDQWTDSFQTEEIINNAEDVHLEAPEAAIDGLTHEMGTDLAFTIQTDPKADLYTASIMLYYGDGYREMIAYELVLEVDEEGHTRIPAEYFQSPGTYQITLMNYGNGFYGSEAGPYEVTVPDGDASVALPEVSVEKAEAGKGFTVVIRHPTAVKLALDGHVIEDDGDHSYAFYYEADISPENGEARITFAPNDLEGSGLYYFYAAACEDGKWSAWTESVETEYAETLIRLPEVHFTDYPEEACFGEPLTFSWAAVDGADYYIARINGNGVISQETRIEAGTTTATLIPQEDTSQNYHSFDIYVEVKAFAENRLSSYESQYIEFYLPWKPVVTAEKTTAYPGETLGFTVQGEGNQMKARITGRKEGYLSFTGENGQSTIALDFTAPGTYTVQVAMRTLRSTWEETAWSQWSDPVTITVTEETEIPASATLTLPGNTLRIEDEAFAGVAARRVVINSGCTFIGPRAFAGCTNLKEIVIPGSVTDISESAFDGCGTLTVITPSGSTAETYATEKGWTVKNN